MYSVRDMICKKSLLFLLLICTFALCSCSTRYTMTDSGPSKITKLERGKIIYIALPRDGSYGNNTYENSGQQTAIALQAALAPYSSMLLSGSEYEDAHDAIASASIKNARYVFIPVVTNWVHRKAAWSGRASGVSITVSVYDLSREEGDQLVMQKDLRVQGRNATLKSQYPGDLAKALLVRFVKDIF